MTEAFSGSSTCVQTLKHYYASIDASLCSEPTPPPQKKNCIHCQIFLMSKNALAERSALVSTGEAYTGLLDS